MSESMNTGLNISSSESRHSTTPTDTSSPSHTGQTRPQVLTYELTPRSLRASANTINQTQLRNEIADAMKDEMVTCSWDEFKDKYLAFNPSSGIIDCAINLLDSSGMIEKQSGQPTWVTFEISEVGENFVFKPLIQICALLATISIDQREHQFSFQQRPDTASSSGIWGGNFKVDGFFHPKDECAIEVRNLGVVAEFKKSSKNEEVAKNRRQLVSAANHIMNSDPRRRFMYGFTMEGSNAAVWYFSRSHSAVSSNFDWQRNPCELLGALLTFIFSSKEELGYDPLIFRQVVGVENIYTEHFVYEVKDTVTSETKRFLTLESLSELHPTCITGRATRVWKVVEVDENMKEKGEPRVLKDVWLDFDSKTEREIQNAIFEDVDNVARRIKGGEAVPGYRELALSEQQLAKDIIGSTYKECFLTILCDTKSGVSKTVPKSAAPDHEFFLEPLKTTTPPAMGTADTSRSQIHPAYRVVTINPPDKATRAREYLPKYRYFVVYREVCKTIQELEEFGEVVRTMEDSAKGLLILFLAGWVHRDISGGNILQSISDKRGLLGDLEYAKPVSESKGRSDPKTGTPFFMSYEIHTGDFIFPPEDESIALRYHYLHDLESMWWLFIWTLLDRVPEKDSNDFARTIFVNSMTVPRDRRHMFFRLNLLSENLKKIMMLPFQSLVIPLNTFHKAILGLYRRGFDPDIKKEFSQVYDPLFRLIEVGTGINTDTRLFSFPLRPRFKKVKAKAGQPVSPERDDDEYQPSQEAEEVVEVEPRGHPRKVRRMN